MMATMEVLTTIGEDTTDGKDAIAEKEPYVLGIDEAGRGPVLGPMVYTAAYCLKSALPLLNALGVNDSKQMTEEHRDILRAKIDRAHFLHTATRVLTADELSEKMLRRVKYNLNLISHDAALNLVQAAINAGANISEVYVDTVGNPDTYAHKFRARFPSLSKVVVAKKADSTYRIVGAASIVAKTTRDRHIRQWDFPEQIRSQELDNLSGNLPVLFTVDRGSGYPSDPLTKKWMDSNCDKIFGFPSFVRFSWGTAKLLLDKNAVQVDWDTDDEEEAEPPAKIQRARTGQIKTKDIQSFFTAKPTVKNTPKSKVTKTQTRELPMLFKTLDQDWKALRDRVSADGTKADASAISALYVCN